MDQALPDLNEMYTALIERNGSYEGIFIAGIKTTGIFCRPTCTAKKPRPENVEYFRSAHDALVHGYRPCKICNPLLPGGATPEWLRPLLHDFEADPAQRIRNADLCTRGLDPGRVSRWFQKQYGMTFQAYQRSYRIALAYGRIKHGEEVTATAFDSGYDSLSGFGDSFKTAAGFAPVHSKSRQIITTTRILTPLGPMFAGATEEGICLLEFADRRMLETQIKRISRALDGECLPGVNRWFDPLAGQLEEYFAGKRKEFDLPLLTPGSPFQQKVWDGLRQIPYGQTRSYAEQASFIGVPRAVRAVAHANGDNRISILIPCHRVIGSDGKPVGYGGGLWRKTYLLQLEADHLSI